ncbi:MAG: hypothetical protein ACK50A_05720 [Sphingobacteriaceae bacterium]
MEQQIENIFLKILDRKRNVEMGLLGLASQYAYDTGQIEEHIKELKQEIQFSRGQLVKVYGEEIIKEIETLPEKVENKETQN